MVGDVLLSSDNYNTFWWNGETIQLDELVEKIERELACDYNKK